VLFTRDVRRSCAASTVVVQSMNVAILAHGHPSTFIRHPSNFAEYTTIIAAYGSCFSFYYKKKHLRFETIADIARALYTIPRNADLGVFSHF